jgi:hypothetical protein
MRRNQFTDLVAMGVAVKDRPFLMAPMISFDLLLATKVFQRALAERDIGEISVWWPEPCGQLCGWRKGCGLVGGLLNVVAV